MARTIKECLEQGPYTSKEIQAMTGVSQSTVARRLIEMADRVVQIREGRSIRYAAACNGNLHSHVIVKFSPKGDTDIAQRWKDILITEYHAARIINTKLHPAADTRLFEMDGRFFLQTQRFDRIKAFGRSSMISLHP